MQADVLVIGSGIAGLAFAIKLAERQPHTQILLVTKSDRFESNTRYAQGGIAAVMDNVRSSFESHICDTIKSGKGFSNPQTVRMVVEKAPPRLGELIEWGAPFDKTAEGEWDYGLEGGHSAARILHCRDRTGWALENALLQQLRRFENITFKTEWFAADLRVENKRCCGADFLDAYNRKLTVHSKITYLATGGSGQMFAKTTNPLVATGDGVAMASRIGAELEHMAFYQFHPTALATTDNPVFLITEALRGFGAYLVNHKGVRFVFDHHPDGELATRDIISRAIFSEIQKSGKSHVWLDCRHLDSEELSRKFPNIVVQCHARGIDVFSEPIPVSPAAHYQCGGIKVDHLGKTSITGLYTNGECASTGLHGANRLASNSLLEAVVFAHEAALSVASEIDRIPAPAPDLGHRPDNSQKPIADKSVLEQLRASLRENLYRFYLQNLGSNPQKETTSELFDLFGKTIRYVHAHQPSPAGLELRNMALAARHYVEDTVSHEVISDSGM